MLRNEQTTRESVEVRCDTEEYPFCAYHAVAQVGLHHGRAGSTEQSGSSIGLSVGDDSSSSQ